MDPGPPVYFVHMASEEREENGRRRLLILFLAIVLALGISVVGSYLIVVSQNPAAKVSGPAFVYGSPSPTP